MSIDSKRKELEKLKAAVVENDDEIIPKVALIQEREDGSTSYKVQDIECSEAEYNKMLENPRIQMIVIRRRKDQ